MGSIGGGEHMVSDLIGSRVYQKYRTFYTVPVTECAELFPVDHAIVVRAVP